MKLELLDKWLLSKLEKVTADVTVALENCQFNTAIEAIRNFTWHLFCDFYIEAIKHRLYRPEEYGEKKRKAAQFTLYTAIYRILQLLAPITPHITEEIYQHMYAEDMKHESIHVTSWPALEADRIDDEAEKYGDLIMAVISSIRKEKSERKIPLNAPIKKLKIYGGSTKGAHILEMAKEDIVGTLKAEKIEILPEKGEGKEVEGYSNIRFNAEY